MKIVTGNFSFDFIVNSDINKEMLERKLAFALNDAFSTVLHDLNIEVWDSEPTAFEPMYVETIEENNSFSYNIEQRHE